MKKTHVLALIAIIVAIGAILSSLYDAETYSGFNDARKHEGKQFQIIGKLSKEKEITQQIENGSVWLSFFMIDEEGVEQQVYFQGTKPQDFEKSEQVVVVGGFEKDSFVASNLLLKCPSKYNEGSLSDSSFVAK